MICLLGLSGSFGFAGCSGGNSALLHVTADMPVDQYDLYVRDESSKKLIVHSGWSDATKMGARDLTRDELKIGVKLPGPGDYTVVIDGVKGPLDNTRPAMGSQLFFFATRQHFEGDVDLAAVLLHVPADDDRDRDLFPDVNVWSTHVPQAAAIAQELLDCNDKSDMAAVHLLASDFNPFAPEKCGDGLDEETCGALDDKCSDRDGDGDPDDSDCAPDDPSIHHPTMADPYPESANCCGYTLGKTGVDRTQTFGPPLCHPGTCGDGIDQDCQNGDVACVHDQDCDGYAAAPGQPAGCSAPSDPAGNDCNDCDPAINPGAAELCDGKDNDCNGRTDETCVACDLDGDGYQRPARGPGDACPDANYVASGKPTDCNDEDRGIFPGSTSANVPVNIPQLKKNNQATCNGTEGGTVACALRGFCRLRPGSPASPVDDDCDGVIDQGCPPVNCDKDGDGFVNMKLAAQCDPQNVLRHDCDDGDPTTFPGAPDNCNDAILHNCTAKVPCTVDADHDGYDDLTYDCDPTSPSRHPFATELCNGIDDDCDGLTDEGNPDPTGVPMTNAQGVQHCTDSSVGECEKTVGDCVCSGNSIANAHFETGNRTACPGETADIDTGASASKPAARCYFAGQPHPEVCDGLDNDCDPSTVDTDPANHLAAGPATDCPGPQPAPICCPPPPAMSGPPACRDAKTDVNNCGSCNNRCSLPNAVPDCVNALCVVQSCTPPFGDCDGMAVNGCEVNLSTDVNHCGQCAKVCMLANATSKCAASVCAVMSCNAGFGNCDNLDGNGCEANLAADPMHCGGCTGAACSTNHITATCSLVNAVPSCTGTCTGTFDDCNNNKRTDGCETDLSNDASNCGGCGMACSTAHITATCGGGNCNGNCAANFADCDGNKRSNGCEVDIRTDNANCGACGTACAAGQHCVAKACVCDAMSCTGCCMGNTCIAVPTVASCGTGGGACSACDATKADNCSAGVCKCGGNALCAAGQACVNGNCVCNAASCPMGCCSGSTCNAQSVNNCGTGGGSCAQCDLIRADGCASGNCRCGGGAQCAMGQHCSGGTCVCDATGCPGGCCSGTTCTAPTTASACGPAGAACVACDPSLANQCSASGACACGGGSPCGATQGTCTGGACKSYGNAACAAGSGCLSGSCSNKTCTCAAPADCDDTTPTSDGCTGGACTCGGAAECNPLTGRCTGGNCLLLGGQYCPGGNGQCLSNNCNGSTKCTCQNASQCDTITPVADSCAGGVCKCGGAATCDPTTSRCLGARCAFMGGQTCVAGTDCISGTCNASKLCTCADVRQCDTITPLADGCSAGQCTCGAGAACVAGQRCVGGQCLGAFGTACAGPSACASGLCLSTCQCTTARECDPNIADTCSGNLCVCGATGGPCAAASARCWFGQCLKLSGQMCNSKNECLSNTCTSMVCG